MKYKISLEDRLEIISECQMAIDDGFTRIEYITESFDNIKGVLDTILDNIYKTLMNMYQNLIRLFDTYILNDVHLIKKYRDRIQDMDEKSFGVLSFETFQYTYLEELPKKFVQKKITLTKDKVEKDLNEKQKIDIKVDVDSMIDAEVRKLFEDIIEVNTCASSTFIKDLEKSTYDLLKGQKILKKIDKGELNSLIDEILTYKEKRKDIMEIRTQITESYRSLKEGINVCFRPEFKDGEKNYYIKYQDGNEVLANKSDANKISWYVNEYNRFYTTMITVFSTVYTAKINIYSEMINSYKIVVRDTLKTCKITNVVDATKSKELKYIPKTLTLDDYTK